MKNKRINIEGFCALYDVPTIYKYRERKGCYSSANGAVVPLVTEGIDDAMIGSGRLEEWDDGLYFVGVIEEDIDLLVTPHYLVAHHVNVKKNDRELLYGEIDYVVLSQTVGYPRTKDYVKCVAKEIK